MDDFNYRNLISNLGRLKNLKSKKEIGNISRNLINYSQKGIKGYEYGEIGQDIEQISYHLNRARLYSASPNSKYNLLSEREVQIAKDGAEILLEKIGSRRHLSGLEGISKAVAIIGIIGAGIFFSSNITGDAIADLSTNTTSWVGGILLVVGLVAGFFWIKSKKKNRIKENSKIKNKENKKILPKKRKKK